MSEKVKFEIQIADVKAPHKWRALSRDGRFYTSKDSFVETLNWDIEVVRKSLKKVKAYFKRNYMAGEFRIVKITVTTAYDVVE